MTPSQAAREPKSNGQRRPRGAYSVASYRRAITRACLKAGIPPWHPHQLRHARACEIDSLYDIETTRIVLGHSNIETTRGYAPGDTMKARRVALEIG